ncbi:MAG TPA: hypothetical protein VFO36_07555, partial [Nitrospiraceae bacterium]|nr:hypothetical protein [Nitrospiraceae bacterium]
VRELSIVEFPPPMPPAGYFDSVKRWLHMEQQYWPAPGSEDTELGVLMGPEVRHGEAEVYTRVQA